MVQQQAREALDSLFVPLTLEHTVDEHAREVDVVGVDLARLDQLLHLGNGDAASARANVTAPALRILDEQGLAQLGFAAGRSEVGLEQYEIHEWWFKRNVDGFHGEERLSRRDEKVV